MASHVVATQQQNERAKRTAERVETDARAVEFNDRAAKNLRSSHLEVLTTSSGNKNQLYVFERQEGTIFRKLIQSLTSIWNHAT